MSTVELLDYNAKENSKAGGMRFFFAVSGFTIASTSGRARHLSILVYDKEYEYGEGGILISMEVVRFVIDCFCILNLFVMNVIILGTKREPKRTKHTRHNL